MIHNKLGPTILGVAISAFSPAWAQVVGETLPAWSPGTLDIHQISTGRGNSALLILPDGTSMLVDAGDLGEGPRVDSARPHGSRRPGEWIARYAKHMLAHDATPALDYALVTHFHRDHVGSPRSASRISEGGFAVSGIAEVAEHLTIRTIIDRGWPDYEYPTAIEGEVIENYRAFIDWQTEQSPLQVERAVPGRADQILLRRDPSSYPDIEVRIVAANGAIWTGVGSETHQHFPSIDDLDTRDYPTENMCSIAIRLSYGRFDYFTGGDLPGIPPAGAPDWHDVETPVARAVGSVEVAVLNHHGEPDSANVDFLRMLQPPVIIIPAWAHEHPTQSVYDRILSTRLYPGPHDVFATYVTEARRTVLSERRLSRFKSIEGHVLVRVAPGGDTFQVIVLDDSSEDFLVKAVSEPYQAH